MVILKSDEEFKIPEISEEDFDKALKELGSINLPNRQPPSDDEIIGNQEQNDTSR